ncbi:MAG: hydrogenase maturation protease [Pirellula sp.]|nr:hydrogenase maturation protease [Pirellula sp.]
MMHAVENLIYGIGSPNGDDQIGWRVVEGIRCLLPEGWHAKSGLVPMDLLNHLEGVHDVHIVDACKGEEKVGTIHRLEWPTRELVTNPVATCHDFSLGITLDLADSLGILPLNVTIWGIVGKMFGPSDSFSLSECDLKKVVEAIISFIRKKDNVRA